MTESDLPDDFPFPIRTEVEVLGPDEPLPMRPIWSRSDTGLVNLRLTPSDAATIEGLLKERIRRITWLDNTGPEEFLEIHRISRMCYEMADVPITSFPTLSNLAREDLEILYALDDRKIDWLTNILNQFRTDAREAGPVGPVEADLAAKDFLTVMTG